MTRLPGQRSRDNSAGSMLRASFISQARLWDPRLDATTFASAPPFGEGAQQARYVTRPRFNGRETRTAADRADVPSPDETGSRPARPARPVGDGASWIGWRYIREIDSAGRYRSPISADVIAAERLRRLSSEGRLDSWTRDIVPDRCRRNVRRSGRRRSKDRRAELHRSASASAAAFGLGFVGLKKRGGSRRRAAGKSGTRD